MSGRLTREEMQKAEEPKFRLLRGRLAKQYLASSIDHSSVGWLGLHDAVLWIALYRETAGAKDFLEAALHHLGAHARQCADVPSKAGPLYECFRTHIGIFLATILSDGHHDWTVFDTALDIRARSCDLPRPEVSAAVTTPVTLFTAAVAALGSLGSHPASGPVIERCRTDAVTAHFRELRDALVAVIDDPSPAACDDVRKAYRASIALSDYRDGMIRGLLLQQLLAISAVAECGDVMKGALEIFE